MDGLLTMMMDNNGWVLTRMMDNDGWVVNNDDG